MDRIRLGMVGGGEGAFIGAVHRIAARLDDRYELVAGALSSSSEKARRSAAALGIEPGRSYDSYQEMASREAQRPDGIEAVAIVTPNHVHFPAAMAFLEADIHVICDKPLTTTARDAAKLVDAVGRSGLIFGLTHNYTGYPLVRHAREMIGAGALGTVRVVQAEYAQDWLSTPLEQSGQKQAAWRTDPTQAGPGGCLGDIGTHAFNLAEFMTGLRLESLCAELSTFVPKRALDDDCRLLLRYAGGARGSLWASQVALGNENGLSIRIYGEQAGLAWNQENPNLLTWAPLGEPPRVITRGGPGVAATGARVTRLPPGHPEGYLEGFATLYSDLADQILARRQDRAPPPESLLVPGVEEGQRAVQFIEAAVRSSEAGGQWVDL